MDQTIILNSPAAESWIRLQWLEFWVNLGLCVSLVAVLVAFCVWLARSEP